MPGVAKILRPPHLSALEILHDKALYKFTFTHIYRFTIDSWLTQVSRENVRASHLNVKSNESNIKLAQWEKQTRHRHRRHDVVVTSCYCWHDINPTRGERIAISIDIAVVDWTMDTYTSTTGPWTPVVLIQESMTGRELTERCWCDAYRPTTCCRYHVPNFMSVFRRYLPVVQTGHAARTF